MLGWQPKAAGRMQAQVLVSHSVETIQMETIELGDPGPGEVLVRHHVTAMSPGTERASLLALPNTPAHIWPRNVGYSAVGEIVAAGAGVDLVPGTRVLTRGRHATADLAPMRDVFLVDDDVPDQNAAFHTMLRISMQAVRKARVEMGETVLVIGGGLIGQLAAQFAYVAGAGRVLVADLDPSRREMAEAVPWLESFDPTCEDARVALAEGHTGGPQVVIESTGFPAPINDAFILAGHLARVVILGSTRGSTEQVNFYRDVHKKGLTIIGAHDSIRQPDAGDNPFLNALAVHWSPRRDIAVALRLAVAGRITLDPLITHRVKGGDFKEIYDLLFDFEPSLVGCLFDWR